jgi:hypothetical protein
MGMAKSLNLNEVKKMKDKIFKILAIGVLMFFTIQLIYFFWFAFIFSYGSGSGTEVAIESYYFKIDSVSFRKEWKSLSVKSVKIKDSIWKREDSFDQYILFINIKKSNHFKMYYYHTRNENNEPITVTHLVRVNNKTNDDFGWISWEKYKEVKLFKKSIINPISNKYKRIELN